MWMTVLYGSSFLLIDSLSMKNVDFIVIKCVPCTVCFSCYHRLTALASLLLAEDENGWHQFQQ